MEEVWKVTCSDNDEEEWPKEVCLSEREMRTLLQMLLCRTLAPHEIVDAVTGKRPDLLEVRSEENGDLHTTGGNILHYTAQRMPRP